ncbi:MAG: hypothetical protein Q9224_004873, partial [Gallowayella concinna]
MPSSEALTDDYVAQLLARDAKDRSIKYSSYGLQAILPKSDDIGRKDAEKKVSTAMIYKNASHGIERTEEGRTTMEAYPRDRGEVVGNMMRMGMGLQNIEIQDNHTSIETTREASDGTEATMKTTAPNLTPTNPDTIAGAAAE